MRDQQRDVNESRGVPKSKQCGQGARVAEVGSGLVPAEMGIWVRGGEVGKGNIVGWGKVR